MKPLEKILYVDDEEDIRSVVEMSLDLGGYTVSVCASGVEALERIPALLPDLILLDVMMPGMDGPETLRRLRQLPEGAEVPVVFMTAKAQRGELDELRALGAADVLTKPFDPMTLAADVQAAWERL